MIDHEQKLAAAADGEFVDGRDPQLLVCALRLFERRIETIRFMIGQHAAV